MPDPLAVVHLPDPTVAPGVPIFWRDATIRWSPEVGRQSATLTLQGNFLGYAAYILKEDLTPALSEISKVDGYIHIDITAGEVDESAPASSLVGVGVRTIRVLSPVRL
jgi:hypothetical protein